MKTDVTGTHIEGVPNLVVQPSQSQKNAVAFLDSDNHWIHLDKNTVMNLYRSISATSAAAPAPKLVPPAPRPKPTMSLDPFDDKFTD